MNTEFERLTALPIVGRVWAGTVETWLALDDARNLLQTRADAGSASEQDAAIEQVLARAAARNRQVIATVPVRQSLQAAA